MTHLFWLDAEQPPDFPSTDLALEEPNGLLAVGGSLSPEWLITAYCRGIFPWFSDNEPIMWWSPAPRMVLFPGEAHASRSLKKHFRQHKITATFNRHFSEVIHCCANSPMREGGTWITQEMIHAYISLHQLGWAHSLEIYYDGEIAGGLYGIAIDDVFFGESMFSLKTNASKYAFVLLSSWMEQMNYQMIDCQLHNKHLASLGAKLVSKTVFEARLPRKAVRTTLPEANLLNNLLARQFQ